MLGKESRVEGRGSRVEGQTRIKLETPRVFLRARRPRGSRRGVLLLVVLSMLVLFMLVGTAFLMSSSQQGKNATNSAKRNKVGNPPTKDLDSALMQVLRDSENAHSAIRYHSLLRDLYGTDGFQGVVYQPATLNLANPVGQVSRFAAATAGNATQQLGPTLGQFIDIYVRALGWNTSTNASVDDLLTPNPVNESGGTYKLVAPERRHVIKLDGNVLGQPQLYSLPLTKGYFNGCVLTITSGPAAGQSTRILDYEYVGDTQSPSGTVVTRLFRFRVMAFPRADGQPLQISGTRTPEIVDLAGEPGGQSPATFIVNGRPFSGTGVGYNPLATVGQPRLNALQLFPTSSSEALGAEIALLPNSVYFNPLSAWNMMATAPGVADPFATPIPVAQLLKLNEVTGRTPFFNYPSFGGPGDVNESYDAADFQNMFVALQTVTPRSQGRVVHSSNPIPLDLGQDDNSNGKPDVFENAADFLRLDLEDVPLPSFHRPDLVNFWYHRLFSLVASGNPTDDHVRAVLQPYAADGSPQYGLTPQQAALIAAIKRQCALRPLREDHPRFDGGNPMSVPPDLSGYSSLFKSVAGAPPQIAIPYWEAVGPWDVDNDNDGVPDSVWVDIGNPVQEAEDGTRYKALVAYLIVDLDSRLNVNAHGLADDIVPPALDQLNDKFTRADFLDVTRQMRGAPGNLAHRYDPNNPSDPTILRSSIQLPRGLGYGPAEISLRSIFPAPLDSSANPVYGNRSESGGFIDDYATILGGRLLADGSAAIAGKYGFNPNLNYPTSSGGDAATAGGNYRFVANAAMVTGEAATPSLHAQLKLFDYPWSVNQLTAFGTPPDLKGRYAIGLDYTGQPVYEVVNDLNPSAFAVNQNLPFNLLAKSPYEIDLSSKQRRGSWAATTKSAATGLPFANSIEAFTQSLNQVDDAAFSPTDLEKVLRAWDTDAGTLPSRLWDTVNAFDPLKLLNSQYGDPVRVRNTALTAFGSANDPELLATAQQIAGINRRLVTTDSFDLPVVGGTVPNQAALAVGPDAAPGRWQFDDNNGNGDDDPAEIGAPGSDDFKAIIGKEPARATIADVLQYRIWTEARRFEMRRQGLTEGAVAGLSAANYAKFMGMVNTRAQAVLVQSPQLLSDLIAPEVIGGNRMDINRPFGDGRDNNNDLVVDDPLEAGDPFLDINGNGRGDNNEPFIDLDGNGGYTSPRDQLWPDLTANGTIGENITFDYTNGQAERLHTAIVKLLNTAVNGGVRNLESQGRQVFARQLYCLMLLLVDENYIAPWDENDPQVMTWMEAERKKLTMASPALSAPEADLIVKRKLTCRMIAQWAVNCVDMRDSDVIMTPFEYDENPWDGCGVWNDAWLDDVTDSAVVAKISFLPLDGDSATDENKGEVIDWPNVPVAPNPYTKKLTTLATADIPTHPLDQTRGVVWGAERPELLITETLAFHDRRTEDLISNDPNGHGEMKHYATDTPPRQDGDPDQGLRPRGSMFVEVYNPWSSNGQYPAELYSRVNSSLAENDPNRLVRSNGVQLDRVTDFAVDANGNLSLQPSNAANGIKRSPVWRLIVVEEWPDIRNSDLVDEARSDRSIPTTYSEPAAYKKQAAAVKTWAPTAAAPYPPFRPTDPDFDVAFDAGFVPRQKGMGKNVFEVQYPYIEREFYFTTDKSPAAPPNPLSKDQTPDYNYSTGSFKLRIPQRVVDIKYSTPNLNFKPGYLQRFISSQLEANSSIPVTQPVIAPILPGRYGVIGSAGTKYNTTDQTYTTTVGRFDLGTSSWNTDDSMHNPNETRRIEIRPDPDPNKQQLVVATNGGDPKDVMNPSLDSMGNKQFDPTTQEIGRDNELINDKGVVRNIYLDANGKPGSNYYEPSVAIPVEGMNISEPAWGWGPREFEAAQEEAAKKGGAPNYFQFKPTANNKYEGRYFGGAGSANKTSYDKPLDGHLQNPIAPELMRNGTTANYRTVHLQRLANPLLPWNPPPLLADGKTKNPDHRANLPINPYRTVDTASVDLTAFNGTSSAEASYPKANEDVKNKLGQWRPWETKEVTNYLQKYVQDKQVWHFRSSERGAWARLNVLGAAASPAVSPPQRVLWAQEPAMVKFRPPAIGFTDLFDLMTVRQMTMRAAEVDPGVTLPNGVGPVTKINHADMVMEHTLGFGNESFGLLYDKQGAKLPNTPAGSTSSSAAPTSAAVGAPAPSDYVWDLDSKDPAIDTRIKVDSTNPWLAWNNRPFVSAEELMNVPAASQATLLRMYSTIDPNKAVTNTPNPYGLTQLGTQATAAPALNPARLAVMQAPFGEMLNVFAASIIPAGYVSGTGEIIPYGAPNFYRILDYVQVPSRFVCTDTLLNAETFNDPVGSDITSPQDPRYTFQPPFNKVSRERDPGRVNLNTVTGRRVPPTSTTAAKIWSEVYDGIMHRVHDANPAAGVLGQPGPAWRDVVLSRRGYAQFNAGSTTPVEKPGAAPPDVYESGLNPMFPTVFANPFRSADAGDLVPLAQMMQFGVDASMLRKHPYDRAANANGTRQPWGPSPMNFGDARDAGFGASESVSVRSLNGAIPSDDPTTRDVLPLFSEKRDTSFSDTDRNPYMMYQPMTRLGNLVTDRSNVFAVWITVGYFEVEPAPNWNDPDPAKKLAIRQRFGATVNDTDAATIAGLALYNRVYPDGYMLGRELGSETGNIQRPRGFYIIDRTEAVGFKPGEDLNVENTIRLRRRIE